MQRRKFIQLSTAGALSFGLHACCKKPLISKDANRNILLSAFDDAEGNHFTARLNLNTKQLHQVSTSFRGHDILPHPNKRNSAIMFGRRPENLCCEINFLQQTVRYITAAQQRHFYGHGCFSAGPNVLFTTENDFANNAGKIGIRDAENYQLQGEYDSYGLGPHDIHLLPDKKTLLVANGGIRTHPDFGRRKLNIDTMRPSLVYIDMHTGKKLAQYELADHQLSIRHVYICPNGEVAAALQYQGDLYRHTPASLVAWQKPGEMLQLLQAPVTAIKPLKGYMADLAFAPTSRILLVSSPRGNQITFWDVDAGRHIKSIPFHEPSGVAFLEQENQFLISNSRGQIIAIDTTTLSINNPVFQNSDIKWDNHFNLWKTG